MERRIKDLHGKKIYLDTNIFIYGVEASKIYAKNIALLWEAIDQKKIVALTSEFTLSEILVKPIKDRNQKLINIYIQLIQNSEILKVSPLSRKILLQAAKLRSNINKPLPDLFHLATAIETDCNYILTNDKKMKNDFVEIIIPN